MIPPLFEIKHGPMGSDGLPETFKLVSLGDWDIENFPDGYQLGGFVDLTNTIKQLEGQLADSIRARDLLRDNWKEAQAENKKLQLKIGRLNGKR